MDAIRLIKQDHRRVESLFEQFETLIGLPGQARTGLIEEICDELMVHTTVEEQVLYPEARRVMEGETVDHAEQEHQQADELIKRVRACDPAGTEIEQAMLELKQTVMHHVQEEEHDFLPRMEEACGEAALEGLGVQIEAHKQQLEGAQTPVQHAATSMTASSDGQASKETLIDLTKEELYEKAQAAEIPGRSKMTKKELAEALANS